MFETLSPFERLRTLLAGTEPGATPIDLTVGSPRHAPPPFVADVLCQHADRFGPYPPIAGIAEFQDAVHGWIDRRYSLGGFLREHGAVLPLSGSREGLFFAAIGARDQLGKKNPAILFANPFYQVYPAAAHAIGARPVPVAAARPGEVLPNLSGLDAATLDDAIAYYFGSPSNPEGACASLADWHALFDAAETHDFFVFADECYSELYRETGTPPVGALEAARERPQILERLFVFNSLSKRSNLAGLRAGFIAGGARAIGALKDFRNQAAPQVPAPLQAVAAAVYGDEAHVIQNRRLYDEKFAAVERRLAPTFGKITPQAGFFLWLHVGGDDVATALDLWREAGVRIVPGSYLVASDGGANPGAGRIRLALVCSLAEAEEAARRLDVFFRSRSRASEAATALG